MFPQFASFVGGDQQLDRESRLARLWHVFFFLQISNVYVGDASFIERFILNDGFDGEIFSEHVSSWVTHDRDSLAQLSQDRLKFVALTRTRVNCRFNPRDGRRLVGSAAVCSIEPDDCNEDQEEIGAAEENVGVDRAFPAPQLPAGKDRGLPRLAYRSRWLDTMVDLQPTWWAMAGQSAAKLVSLLSELIETPIDAGQGSLNIATERLIESFLAIPVVGAPSKLRIANPTHERVSKCYRAKFLLRHTFTSYVTCVQRKQLWLTSWHADTQRMDLRRARLSSTSQVPTKMTVSLGVWLFVGACAMLSHNASRSTWSCTLFSTLPVCSTVRAHCSLARESSKIGMCYSEESPTRESELWMLLIWKKRCLLQSSRTFARVAGCGKIVAPLSVLHRARVFRDFNLELACSGVRVEKGIAKFIRDIASKASDADHHWSRHPVGSVKRPRYTSSSITFRLA